MKLLITSLNSKFIHSNLAIRYLYSYLEQHTDINQEMVEFTINQDLGAITKQIVEMEPDIIAFSVYIWNEEMTKKLVRTLKVIMPDLTIILGGPEVSYTPDDYLINGYCDYVITGEGEKPLLNLINQLKFNNKEVDIDGVSFIQSGFVKKSEFYIHKNLDEIPFPYSTIDNNKIVYYESSRGCPFFCSYCISSTTKGVRFRSLDLVFEELKYFIDNEVALVKFIDRTFNVDIDRSLSILEFIMKHDNWITGFHMELAPNLINDKLIDTLDGIRPGLVQFEIGIQSIHADVTKAVDRNLKFDAYKEKLVKLIENKSIHTHVDLIAGLPNETYNRFMESFDAVYALHADHFQLGFLKVLKGSKIMEQVNEHGYAYRNYAPYEIIANDYISFRELSKLVEIEEILESYANSHHFIESIKYLIEFFEKPSVFYESFSSFLKGIGFYEQSQQKDKLYRYLFDFATTMDGVNLTVFAELLKYDYVSSARYKQLDIFSEIEVESLKPLTHEVLKNQQFVDLYLPHRKELSPKNIIKKVNFIPMALNPLSPDEEGLYVLAVDYEYNHKVIISLKEFKAYGIN